MEWSLDFMGERCLLKDIADSNVLSIFEPARLRADEILEGLEQEIKEGVRPVIFVEADGRWGIQFEGDLHCVNVAYDALKVQGIDGASGEGSSGILVN